MAKVVFKDNGKELYFNGEMYDVKDESSDVNYIIFHCINDKKETNLYAELGKQVKQNTDSNQSSEKKQNTFLKNPVNDLFFTAQNTSFASSEKFEFPTYRCQLTSSALPSFPVPPPESLLS